MDCLSEAAERLGRVIAQRVEASAVPKLINMHVKGANWSR
jgi:hypothetical protein